MSEEASTQVHNPWKKIPKAPTTHSFAQVQQEQQELSDEQYALRLQLQQEGFDVKQLHQIFQSEAQSDQAQSTQQDKVDDDLAYAMKLQEQFDREARASVPSTSQQEDKDHTSDNDVVLAKELQNQFDEEYNQHITDRERRANTFTNGKVAVSFDLYRDMPRSLESPKSPLDEQEEAEVWEDDIEEATCYDKGTRTPRDDAGNIITKHNPTVGGRRNRQKMEKDFPLSFASGDLRKSKKDDIKFGNKIYNDLQRFANKREKARARLHEKKEHSTAVMAVDASTRLLLHRLVNNRCLEEVHGVVSTGKESIILHADRAVDPEDPTCRDTIECAVKVFKTTLTEFKARQQFLHGDRRYESRIGKQVARKLVKIWAEKEFANLTRMHRSGLRCPQVFIQKKHVLVMSFIGRDGQPSPKLKDVQWKNESELGGCFDEVMQGMTTMYNECKLVHADLSEYNLLYHDNKPWFIDVGQAVETKHARATEFLYRDCVNVRAFFEKMGLSSLPTAIDMLYDISGIQISKEQASDFMTKISAPSKAAEKRYKKNPMRVEDSSDICIHLETMTELEKQKVYDDAMSDEDSSSEDITGDAGDDDESTFQESLRDALQATDDQVGVVEQQDTAQAINDAMAEDSD